MASSRSEEWAMHVEQWKESGLTAKRFAEEVGLNPSTLTYWASRLGVSKKRHAARESDRRAEALEKAIAPRARHPKGEFVELSTHESEVSSPGFEVILRGNIIVRVPRSFDEKSLTRVVRAIENAQ